MKIILLLFALTSASLARADDTKIRQAVEKGIVTGQFLQTLTPDDVPDKWKVQDETVEKDTYVARTYKRGGVRVLTVLWPKNQRPDQQKSFTATLYHDDKRLVTIAHIGDSTSIMPPDASKEYQVFTSVKDDGAVSLTILKKDETFFESIVLKGRETHPIDDLDYTKAALAMEGISKPIIEAIQGGMDRRPAKKSDE